MSFERDVERLDYGWFLTSVKRIPQAHSWFILRNVRLHCCSLPCVARAVEPLFGCGRRCLFNIFFKKGLSSAVPVGFAIRVAVGRGGVHDVCGRQLALAERAVDGMVGKEERGAEARCWRSQTSDPQRPALKALPNLSLNVSDTLRATRAK